MLAAFVLVFVYMLYTEPSDVTDPSLVAPVDGL